MTVKAINFEMVNREFRPHHLEMMNDFKKKELEGKLKILSFDELPHMYVGETNRFLYNGLFGLKIGYETYSKSTFQMRFEEAQ